MVPLFKKKNSFGISTVTELNLEEPEGADNVMDDILV